jgi:hypothetical protein
MTTAADFVGKFRAWPFERCVREILLNPNDFVEMLHALLDVSSDFNDEQMDTLWTALFARLEAYEEGVPTAWCDAIRLLLKSDLYKVVLRVDEFMNNWFFEQFAFDMIDVGAKQCFRALIEKKWANWLTVPLRSGRDRKKRITLTEYANEQGCEWFAEVVSASAGAVYASKRVQR